MAFNISASFIYPAFLQIGLYVSNLLILHLFNKISVRINRSLNKQFAIKTFLLALSFGLTIVIYDKTIVSENLSEKVVVQTESLAISVAD